MTQLSSKTTSKNIFSVLRLLGLILAILLSSSVHSQRLTLEGKISTASDIEVEGINVFNLTTSKGTVTDATGKFFIAVSLNDSLSISALHIQEKKIVIGDEQMLNKKINIHLNEKMNELGTVTLGRALTGFIGSDANIIPTQTPITASSLGLPNADLPQLSKTERALYAANSGPVDALINMFSGRTKMLKKHLEFDKTAALTLKLLEKFPETYFIDALKIDKLKVYSFIFFCEDDPNYQTVMKQNSMEIIEFLQRKSKEYRRQLEKQ